MEDFDTIIIGAGLAGLACAQHLRDRGQHVVVLEGSDRVGGRVTSDHVDGFIVDRGFQVLNPAYPSLRDVLPVDRLDLRGFPRAVGVRREGGLAQLEDPSRNPSAIVGDLASGLVSLRSGALGLFAARSALLDEPLGKAFDAVGFGGPLRSEVVEPFLAGVVCEDQQQTSSSFVVWLLRMFALGTPGVPSRGIRRLPEVLAQGTLVRLETPVRSVSGGVVDLDGSSLRARNVVVAAGAGASDLVPGSGREVTWHGTRTFWFACEQAPAGDARIHVDGRGRGPVKVSSVVSQASSYYAPEGRHLVAALTLTNASDPQEADVRRQLGEIYGCSTDAWETVAVHDIAHTLPAVPAPYKGSGRAVRVDDLTLLAGDTCGNASIEGALASGLAAARRVLQG